MHTHNFKHKIPDSFSVWVCMVECMHVCVNGGMYVCGEHAYTYVHGG